MLLFLLSFMLSFNLAASEMCEEIYFTGDDDLPPYLILEDKPQGLGVRILNNIFKELDIPTKFVDNNDIRRINHALQFGDISFYFMNYEHKDIPEYLEMIKPGISDPLVIVMNKNAMEISSWEELIGMRGLATKNFKLPHDFQEFSNRYLYISKKMDLQDSLAELYEKKVDYVVGSLRQLKYALQNYQEYANLAIMNYPELKWDSDMHLFMSRSSPCYEYVSYVTKWMRNNVQNI